MIKKNCWEVMKCGREPDGKNKVLGTCPATESNEHDGINNGKFAGRYCWSVAGTFCNGNLQGSVARKLNDCLKCGFFMMVKEEEGENFVFSVGNKKETAD